MNNTMTFAERNPFIATCYHCKHQEWRTTKADTLDAIAQHVCETRYRTVTITAPELPDWAFAI